MPFIIPEDGVQVTQRVVVDMFGDPVAHRAVKSSKLPAVLLVTAAAAGAGALSWARSGAIGLLRRDVSSETGGGGAIERSGYCR